MTGAADVVDVVDVAAVAVATAAVVAGVAVATVHHHRRPDPTPPIPRRAMRRLLERLEGDQ